MVDGGDVKVAGTEFQIYVYTVACTSSVTASTVTTSGTVSVFHFEFNYVFTITTEIGQG